MSADKYNDKKKKTIQKKIKKLSKKVKLGAKHSESQYSIAMRRFRRSRIGIIGLGIIVSMFVIGVFATPMEFKFALRNDEPISFSWDGFSPFDPARFFDITVYKTDNVSDRQTLYFPGYQPPGIYEGYVYDNKSDLSQARAVTINHVFGTNRDSQDLFSRLILGARISLFVSVGAVLLSLLIGLPIGLLAGYYGGKVDEALMRLTDLFLNLPFFLLILFAIQLFYQNQELEKFLSKLQLDGEFFIFVIIAGLGIFGWTLIARLVRAQIYQIKAMDYVEAARALGATPNRIMLRHILPNILVTLLVIVSIAMGGNIVAEAAISFLLFNETGVSSWGIEISNGLTTMAVAWWPVIFPGIFITLAVLGFNLLGDALTDAFDPKAR